MTMKKLLLSICLLLLATPAWAATWYACSSTANIDAAAEWKTASGGSCSCSGSTLTWGNQADGDTLNANGCTALAINVDPGAATGASSNNCGTVTKTVTLTNDATNGGAFTLATSANLVTHFNATSTKNSLVVVTGSTNGLTNCGTLTGGGVASAPGVSDGHTVVTTYYRGAVNGGSLASANTSAGLNVTGNGAASINGNVTQGSGGNPGLYASGAAAITLVGNCIGESTTAYAGGAACMETNATGSITLTGNKIDGMFGNATSGRVYFTPSATNYTLSPKDASYTQVFDGHATEMPADPGAANVKVSTTYGSYTGTLQTVSADGGW